MSKPGKHHHAHEASRVHQAHIPYWRRAHTDWRFWIGVLLMLAAMMIYVMTMDLAWRPRLQKPQPMSGASMISEPAQPGGKRAARRGTCVPAMETDGGKRAPRGGLLPRAFVAAL